MKNLFRMTMIAAACAGAISLAACGKTGPLLPSSVPSVSDVQAVATKICAFVPYASTITSIIGLADPMLATAEEIAQAICTAITSRSARAGVTPKVKGVRVRGRPA